MIGGLKCGTTSLHHYLNLHPEIAMSRPKELNYFVAELTMRERPAKDEDDARRRYYRLTTFGRAVAEAETRRLGELLRLARASGFTSTRKAT